MVADRWNLARTECGPPVLSYAERRGLVVKPQPYIPVHKAKIERSQNCLLECFKIGEFKNKKDGDSVKIITEPQTLQDKVFVLFEPQ